MEEQFKKNDVVVTKDGRFLGKVMSLHHRVDDIDPQLELYAAYVKVWNEEMGDEFFIPTDFVHSKDAATNDFALSVDFKTVEKETWTRMPDFVARGEDREDSLTVRKTE
jgi:hypothetical protein